MERDHEDTPGYQRLPRPDPPYPDNISIARQAGMTRDGGVRTMRRVSTWTAAALIAGVAATTGYFAHASQPAASATTVPVGTATTGPGVHHKACPAAPVATSGGSGVVAAVPSSGNCAGGSSGTVVPTWSGRDD